MDNQAVDRAMVQLQASFEAAVAAAQPVFKELKAVFTRISEQVLETMRVMSRALRAGRRHEGLMPSEMARRLGITTRDYRRLERYGLGQRSA